VGLKGLKDVLVPVDETISLTFETIKQHFAAKLLTFVFHILKRTYRNALIIILFRRDRKSKSNIDDHWIQLIPFTTYLDPNGYKRQLINRKTLAPSSFGRIIVWLHDHLNYWSTKQEPYANSYTCFRGMLILCEFTVSSQLKSSVLYQRWVVRITFEICKKNLTLESYILLT